MADAAIPLEDFLTYQLHRTHAAVSANTARFLKRSFGVGVSQHRVLACIAERDSPTFTELWQVSGMDRGMLSRTLSRMVDDGLLTRAPSTADTRHRCFRLTTKGRQIQQGIRPHMQARQRRLCETIPEADRAAFLRVCAALRTLSALDASID